MAELPPDIDQAMFLWLDRQGKRVNARPGASGALQSRLTPPQHRFTRQRHDCRTSNRLIWHAGGFGLSLSFQ
jgi:hypothetical protein